MHITCRWGPPVIPTLSRLMQEDPEIITMLVLTVSLWSASKNDTILIEKTKMRPNPYWELLMGSTHFLNSHLPRLAVGRAVKSTILRASANSYTKCGYYHISSPGLGQLNKTHIFLLNDSWLTCYSALPFPAKASLSPSPVRYSSKQVFDTLAIGGV